MTVIPDAAPVPYVTDVDADVATKAVREFGARVSAMLRAVRHPSAPALGSWDLTDVAVHLSHAVDGVKTMARGSGSILTDLWELPGFLETLVSGEEERDLAALADRIEASVAEFLAVVAAARSSGEADRAWLVEGTRMPLATLLCHVLNELVVHGGDIAKAEGVPWPVSAQEASLVLRGFLFPVVAAMGRAMVDQKAAAGLRANFEIRLRGGGRAYFGFDDGDLRVTATAPRRVHCHLSVDPNAFMLVAWGRRSQWSGIARGQLVAWGRRPWLGVRLRPLMRNP